MDLLLEGSRVYSSWFSLPNNRTLISAVRTYIGVPCPVSRWTHPSLAARRATHEKGANRRLRAARRTPGPNGRLTLCAVARATCRIHLTAASAGQGSGSLP